MANNTYKVGQQHLKVGLEPHRRARHNFLGALWQQSAGDGYTPHGNPVAVVRDAANRKEH